MKKMMLLLLVLPLFAFAQNKTLLGVDRYFPKADKVKQFEKAVALHAQQYHKDDHKWRVYTIETGPDAGGYMVIEGPTNWDGLDKRGDLGAAHTKDWESTVQPTLSDRTSTMYLTVREDLSTVVQGDYSDKISINHLFFKPGFYGEVQTNIQGLKKLWQADGSTVAVYESSLSGEPQFTIVTRYKTGLKERDVVQPNTLPVRFAAANGEGSWDKYLSSLKESIDHQWSELLYHKSALDSK